MYSYIVVDDEYLIRKGIIKRIENLNMSLKLIGEGNDGEEAIALIESLHPDIVLTDMQMPTMNGKLLLGHIKDNYPDIKLIVISGYSDFEYLQEAISAHVEEYILKPLNQEEIEKALTKAIQSLHAQHKVTAEFNHLIAENAEATYDTDLKSLGQLITTPQLTYPNSTWKSTKIQDISNNTILTLITIYSYENTSDSIYNRIIDSLDQSNCVIIPGSVFNAFNFILCYTKISSKRASLASHEEIKANVLIELMPFMDIASESQYLISVSQPFQDLNNLNTAYLETLSSLNKRYINDAEKLVTYNDTPFTSIEKFDEELNQESLLFYIESANFKETQILLEKTFSEITNIPNLNLQQFKELSMHLFRSVDKILVEYPIIFKNYDFMKKYNTLLENSFDIASIMNTTFNLIQNIILLLENKSIYNSKDLIVNVTTYINKNYTKNITLEKISELFFINPSYFCHLFKKKTGDNFNHYINTLRISEAKDLLINTDYKIYQIAKELGYNNEKYFFRQFKKLTGQTPEEYRTSNTPK